MFFRRRQPAEPTWEDRLDALRKAGFELTREADGRVTARKHGCAAMISEGHIERAGWVLGGRIAQLVDGGYQKFWDSGDRRAPALADQLMALHDFEEDLREGLGLASLYNTSLGTTNDLHVYDRLEGR